MAKKYLLIIPLIALVGFLFFPKIGLANDFENITPEEAGKYLELPGKDAEKILSTLIQVLTTEGINLLTSGYATDNDIAVAGILREVVRIDVLNHLLIDAPIEVTGKIIKSSVGIARLFGIQDISVALDKFEKETVKMAVDYGMKVLFQNEIRVTPGAIKFGYNSCQEGEKEVVFQYLIIYQPLDTNRGKVEIRFYSPNYIESPERKQSIGFTKGIYYDLQHDLPPFITEISGEVEKTDLGVYRWIKGPSVEITFSDSVPDFGIKPLTFWERHLLKPIETAIKNIEVIITKVTGKSLGISDIWDKIKSTFSRFNPFSPAAVVETQLFEEEEFEEEELEVEEPSAELGQEVGQAISEPELTDEEIQQILNSISEKIKASNEEAEEKEEEIVEEIEETEETKEEEEIPVTICEITPGASPVRDKVIINEIAWMGTVGSYNDEWIELKNISGSEINLAGWQLLDEEKQIEIIFNINNGSPTSIISTNGFFLLERTDDDSVPNIVADFIYTGTLSNTNEALYLFDENCQLQDEVMADPDWPAGDNSSKRTMERKNNLGWQTSSDVGGTPKSENSEGYYEYQGGGYSPPPSPPPPEPEPVCDSENIDLCTIQELCEGANLYWYNETCNLEPEPPKILISEIQISPIEERFIELYNPNDQDVDLTGWYIQRKTETGTSWDSLVSSTKFEGKSIQQQSHFLLGRTSTLNPNILLEDLTLTENNVISLKSPNREIVDKVGWGTAQDYEGAPTLNPQSGKSIGRKWIEGTGYQDTDNNSDDFEIQIPTPKAKNQPLPPEEPPAEETYLPATEHNIDKGDDRPEQANPWENPSLAYDGNFNGDPDEIAAKSKVSHNTWTAWLELFPPKEISQGVRFWIDPASQRSFFRVEILYSDYESWDCLRNWNFPYSPAPKGEWVILDYPEGERSIEKARVKFHSAGYSGFYPVYLSEFQFKIYK